MLHNNLPRSFATQTRDGLMSSEDKTKVDNLSNENSTSREDINNLQKVYTDLKGDQEAHTKDNNNPHSVTKKQIGLENVDNTSDLDKPVSKATEEILKGYLKLSGGKLTGDLDFNFTEIQGIAGTYVEDSNARYHHGAINIREVGGILSSKTDIAYAPRICFNWAPSNGASIALDSKGIINFLSKNDNTNAAIRSGDIVSTGTITAFDIITSDKIKGYDFYASDIYFHYTKNIETEYSSKISESKKGQIDINGVKIYNKTVKALSYYSAGSSNYAEWFEIENPNEGFEVGSIISWSNSGVIKSTKADDNMVIGVHSDSYGYIIGGEDLIDMEQNKTKFIPVALKGIVKVKVTGIVNKGDFIVSSNMTGIGIAKANPITGTIIGKALEDKTTEDIDKISILIMLS